MARTAKPNDRPRKNGGDLDFAAELFKAADKMRGNLEPSEYKHVALGLIFLKYISDAFEAHRAKLAKEEYADPEDPEEYLAANVFWVPKEARWSHLQANARRPEIGKLIDEAMEAIEAPLQQLVGAVRMVLEQTPPELSSDIIDKGMVMSGGGSLLRNIDKLLTQVTGVPCHVAENALDCVALGTGIALEHFDFFKKSLVQQV